MSPIIEQIDQAMPPGGILEVTLENLQNVCAALVTARVHILTQEAQIRALMRFHAHRREWND